MNFEYSAKTREMIARVRAFMDEHIYPNEKRYAEEVASGERSKSEENGYGDTEFVPWQVGATM